MTKFKLNEEYDHKADIVSDAFHIDKKRSGLIINKFVKYWDSLSPEDFMRSKVIDFIEQQDWTTIEKLYAVERFISIYEDKEHDILPEQMDENKKIELISSTIQKVLPDSIGTAIFLKEGYIITTKNQEFADIINKTLKSGQKGFIADKEANLNFYQ